MRLTTTILVLLAGLAISVAAYALTGGHVVLVFLPLVLGLPLLWRRRS
jgi:hypothetical protein